MPANEFSSADERMASLRAHQARRNQPGLSPSIEAALRIAQSYARGGGIAPGLPMAPFQPIAAPSTVMPRIAAGHMPRILPMTRGHFADGGSTLPSHVLHALAIVQDHVRKHYDDGGTIDGQFGSATTGNMQLGGLQLGGGPGPGINSGSSGVANWQPPVLTPINNSGSLGLSRSIPPAAMAGGAGSGQPYAPPTLRPHLARGGSTLHPSVLRALALVGQHRGHFDDGGDAGNGGNGNGNGDGNGNGNSDGNGNGNSDGNGPGGNSPGGNTDNGNNTGGGFSSGAMSGADSNSPATGGSFSSGAMSGTDSAPAGGIGGAVGTTAASTDTGQTTTGNVSSPYGGMPSSMTGVTSNVASAPASNDIGMSNVGAITGSVSTGPTTGFGAFSNAAGPMSTNPSAGMTAAGMDAGMTSPGSYGENVTAALGNTSNPYGAAPSAMTGSPSDGFASSPNIGTFGNIGLGSVDNPGVTGDLGASAPAGVTTGLGAYGFSTNELAGFDNFNENHTTASFGDQGAGDVASSSLGATGYTGSYADNEQGQMNGLLAGPVGYVGGPMGLGTSPSGDTAASAPAAGFSPDMSGFNQAQQNGLGVGSLAGSAPAPGTDSAPATDASQDPASVEGLHALTVHGDIPSAPQTNFGQVTAPSSVPAGTVGGFDFDGYTHAMQNVEDPTGDPNAVSPTGAYGLSQFTQATWSGLRNNYSGLGLPASPQQATPTQQANATNALTAENIGALEKSGITPSFASAYLAHNAGISNAISAFKASDDTPISSVIAPGTIAVNKAVYGGVQTVGELKSRLASLMGGSGALSGPGLGVNATNAMAPGVQPATFSPSGFTFGAPTASYGNVATTSEQAPAVASAPAVTAAPTMVSTPYSPTATETASINADGYDASPVNGMAYNAFGPTVGYSVVAAPADTPIGDVVPADVQQQHQSLFAGVQTVGELRANLANVAATAGPQVASAASSTVAAPAEASPVTVTRSTPVSVGLGSYAGEDGNDPTAVGLGLMAANVPSYTSNIGAPGMAPTPSAQAPSNLAGWSQVGAPLGINSFTSMAMNQPGFQAESAPSTTTSTTTSQPATGQPATTSDATTDTPAPAKTLTVNKTAGNMAANVALGAFGPIGMIGAGANMVSGLLGGPTIADAVNAALSHPGAPTSVTGTSGNAPGDRSSSQYLQSMMSTSPASTTSSSSPAPASSDPYSDAMEAYLTTMLADGSGSSTSESASSNLGVTNALQNSRIGRAPLQPIYRPMEDPTVLRALGLVS